MRAVLETLIIFAVMTATTATILWGIGAKFGWSL